MKKYLYLGFSGLLFLIASIAMPGCSKDEFDPEDYTQSMISGEYGKGKYWNLTTILNGDTIQTDGYVRLDTKSQEADFRFVNVIPGESSKEFNKIPLIVSDNGLAFTIDYLRKSDNIHIFGTVTFGEMTVDMTLSE